uniref:Uncharacterized protein n=1 Tax=Anopheles coluzzii TaxID=1518534 RepID=A0A8W7PZN5_ANOCL
MGTADSSQAVGITSTKVDCSKRSNVKRFGLRDVKNQYAYVRDHILGTVLVLLAVHRLVLGLGLVLGQHTALEPGQGQSTALEPGQGQSIALEPGQGQSTALELGQGQSTALELGQGPSTALEPEQGQSTGLEPEQGQERSALGQGQERSALGPEQERRTELEPEQERRTLLEQERSGLERRQQWLGILLLPNGLPNFL